MVYELDSYSSRIHNCFHVSFLKLILGQTMLVEIEIAKLDEKGKLILEIE